MVKVGDIVKTKSRAGKGLIPAVVTRIITYKDYRDYGKEKISNVDLLFADGTYGYRSEGKFTTTGRHIDMQAVLDSIK